MFDWNDEELANILWGESGESEDHIVPYPGQTEGKPPVLYGDDSKKEANYEPIEHKTDTTKAENGVQIGDTSGYDISAHGRELGLSSWPLANSPNADKVGRESTAADNRMSSSKNDVSLRDEAAEFNKGSELFENQQEESEEGQFGDYEWANIGSFDDLDRIFSNNDPIFGDMSVGNADELWTDSKDLTSTPTPFVNEALNESTSHVPLDAQASLDNVEHCGGKNKIFLKEKAAEINGRSDACQQGHRVVTSGTDRSGKGNKQKKSLKHHATAVTDKNKEVTWAPYGSPFQQVNSPYVQPMVSHCPQFLPPQQMQLRRPEFLQQKHFPSPLLISPFYGNMVNHYHTAAAPVNMAHFHEVPPGPSYVNSFNKVFEAAVKPSAMSPQEKIEKLRKRQQLRAISAIQRQRQQLGDQVSVDESHGSFASPGSSSPIEQDDANTNSSGIDNVSVEESVLCRLEDTISKLDTRVNLCIRDSLFRLAKSATRRQCPNDANSRDESLSNNDTEDHEPFPTMVDIETCTNPIDRAVAHLLFHQPVEYPGKPAETPESPLSLNILEQNENSSKTSIDAYLPENSQLTSPQRSKTNGRFSGLTNVSRLDSLNNENADQGCNIDEGSK